MIMNRVLMKSAPLEGEGANLGLCSGTLARYHFNRSVYEATERNKQYGTGNTIQSLQFKLKVIYPNIRAGTLKERA